MSVATVSRVLNNHPHVDAETRERVLSAANRWGYTPAVGKRSTTVIGLAYPGEVVRGDYGAFDAALLSGVLRGVNEQRFDVHIVSIQRDKNPGETFTQFFNRKGLRGVILRTVEETRWMVEAIAEEGFPSLVVADRFEHPSVNFVCCESGEDSARAVAHLVDLGHRRIGIGVHAVPDTDHKDRRAGYERAMREAGLEVDPSLCLDIYASMDGGAGAITRWLSMSNPPTAAYFTDPLASVGALRRCQELGVKVPQELSIVGFDDSDIRSHTYPAMTAVCQDAAMLGFEAARWMTRMLAGQAEKRIRMIRQTRFEINQTTGAAPAKPVRVLPDGSRAEAIPSVRVVTESGARASRGRNRPAS